MRNSRREVLISSSSPCSVIKTRIASRTHTMFSDIQHLQSLWETHPTLRRPDNTESFGACLSVPSTGAQQNLLGVVSRWVKAKARAFTHAARPARESGGRRRCTIQFWIAGVGVSTPASAIQHCCCIVLCHFLVHS